MGGALHGRGRSRELSFAVAFANTQTLLKIGTPPSGVDIGYAMTHGFDAAIAHSTEKVLRRAGVRGHTVGSAPAPARVRRGCLRVAREIADTPVDNRAFGVVYQAMSSSAKALGLLPSSNFEREFQLSRDGEVCAVELWPTSARLQADRLEVAIPDAKAHLFNALGTYLVGMLKPQESMGTADLHELYCTTGRVLADVLAAANVRSPARSKGEIARCHLTRLIATVDELKRATQPARVRREQRKQEKQESRRRGEELPPKQAAPQQAAPLAVSQPTTQPVESDVARRAALEDEVKLLNMAARERKMAAKKMATTGGESQHYAPRDQAAVESADPRQEMSQGALRRRQRREKQQRARQQRAETKELAEDEEFLRMARQVERLKKEEGTVVNQDLESLTEDLQVALDKFYPEESSRIPEKHRGNPQALELVAHIAGGAQRGEQMRRELASFISSLAADVVAPDAETFPGALLETLLAGTHHECDLSAAGQVYGPFADAFRAHSWSDHLMRRVGRRAILATAAACN